MDTIKCKKCGIDINQKQQRGPKKKTCDACRTANKSEYYANWYATNGRKRSGGYSIQIMEWRRQNPEKVAAHKIVAAALKGGRIVNPGKCADCGKISNYLDAHHTDYTKPLEITWLCISCHRKKHKNNTGGNKMEKDMRTITDVDGETYNYDNNSPMCLNNPWSGRPVEIKKSDKLNLDNWAILMDDELREHIHNQLAPCSDWDFIRAWYELVDTDEASRVILGS